MWDYLLASLVWSAGGMVLGELLGELGYDIGKFVRHSGRQHRDDT